MSRPATAAWHVPDALLDRFAAIGDEPLPPSDLWSVEAHLERCPDCRARLARIMAVQAPEVLALVESARTELAPRISALPAPPPRRRRLTGRVTGGLLMSRLTACVAVLLAAALLDVAADSGSPSWVLLAAPLLPLLGVAASWSRALDPAHDLVAGTPSAGLPLLLRRTCVVLLVVVPAALLASFATGAGGQAAWLLPCLGLTTAAVALGSVTDLTRAAGALAAAWALGAIAPALALDDTPAPLEPSWLPAWVALTVLAAGVIALRRTTYRRAPGG